jgi:ferredoxin
VLAAPDVVTLDENGKSRVLHELIDAAFADEARTAELLCPEEAITIIE